MAPKEEQRIEIEKTHRDLLVSSNQAVRPNCSDFLGTALIKNLEFFAVYLLRHAENASFEPPEWNFGPLDATIESPSFSYI
jgi:hypothetical protein